MNGNRRLAVLRLSLGGSILALSLAHVLGLRPETVISDVAIAFVAGAVAAAVLLRARHV